MADCADAVVQVLEALKIIQPVVSIGTSWGGLVAGEFALRHYACLACSDQRFASRSSVRSPFTA